MTRLERLSMGVAIITEGVILAGHPSSLIPKERLLCYKNYDTFSRLPWGKLAYKILSKSIKRLNTSWWTGDSYKVRGFVLAINLWAMSSVPILGKAFGKPCEVTTSSDPLCLHWDSTRAPTITEVLEVEKKSNGVVTTVIGLCENFNHLVNPTLDDDKDFDSVVKLVEQGYKLRKSDWEQGFVNVFLTAEDIGHQRGNEDKDVQQKSKEQAQDEEEQQLEAEAEVGEGDKERETSKANELWKKKMNKWKLIQKWRSLCKLKGRNEEEKIRSKHKMKKNNNWKLRLKWAKGHTVVEEEDEQMEADTEVRSLCKLKGRNEEEEIRSKHKMKKNNNWKLRLKWAKVIKKEKLQKPMK
ncbi:hypothetical protein Rs2_10502 [Raphanus sativus]|nr:hypothetical protein Rs2_10502 [Raphanus sativus]